MKETNAGSGMVQVQREQNSTLSKSRSIAQQRVAMKSRQNPTPKSITLSHHRSQQNESRRYQQQDGVLSMDEIMEDLRVFEQQQRESTRLLASIKLTKKHKLEQRASYEAKYSSLQYKNGEMKEQLSRSREMLSINTREIGTVKLRAARSGDDLKKIGVKLSRVLQASTKLRRQNESLEDITTVLRKRKSTLDKILSKYSDSIQAVELKFEDARHREELHLKSIHTNKSKSRELSERIATDRSRRLGYEQELFDAQQIESATKLRVDSIEEEANSENERSAEMEQNGQMRLVGCLNEQEEIAKDICTEGINIEVLKEQLEKTKQIYLCYMKEEGQEVFEGDWSRSDLTKVQFKVETEERELLRNESQINDLNVNINSLEDECDDKLAQEADTRQKITNIQDELKQAASSEEIRRKNHIKLIDEIGQDRKIVSQLQKSVEEILESQKMAKDSTYDQLNLMTQRKKEGQELIEVSHVKMIGKLDDLDKSQKLLVEEQNVVTASIDEAKANANKSKLIFDNAKHQLLMLKKSEDSNLKSTEIGDMTSSQSAYLEKIETRISNILEKYPCLEMLNFKFDPNVSKEDQVSRALAELRTSCQARLQSATQERGLRFDVAKKDALARRIKEEELLRKKEAEATAAIEKARQDEAKAIATAQEKEIKRIAAAEKSRRLREEQERFEALEVERVRLEQEKIRERMIQQEKERIIRECQKAKLIEEERFHREQERAELELEKAVKVAAEAAALAEKRRQMEHRAAVEKMKKTRADAKRRAEEDAAREEAEATKEQKRMMALVEKKRMERAEMKRRAEKEAAVAEAELLEEEKAIAQANEVRRKVRAEARHRAEMEAAREQNNILEEEKKIAKVKKERERRRAELKTRLEAEEQIRMSKDAQEDEFFSVDQRKFEKCDERKQKKHCGARTSMENKHSKERSEKAKEKGNSAQQEEIRHTKAVKIREKIIGKCEELKSVKEDWLISTKPAANATALDEKRLRRGHKAEAIKAKEEKEKLVKDYKRVRNRQKVAETKKRMDGKTGETSTDLKDITEKVQFTEDRDIERDDLLVTLEKGKFRSNCSDKKRDVDKENNRDYFHKSERKRKANSLVSNTIDAHRKRHSTTKAISRGEGRLELEAKEKRKARPKSAKHGSLASFAKPASFANIETSKFSKKKRDAKPDAKPRQHLNLFEHKTSYVKAISASNVKVKEGISKNISGSEKHASSQLNAKKKTSHFKNACSRSSIHSLAGGLNKSVCSSSTILKPRKRKKKDSMKHKSQNTMSSMDRDIDFHF